LSNGEVGASESACSSRINRRIARFEIEAGVFFVCLVMLTGLMFV
jgi:hypothetical protein